MKDIDIIKEEINRLKKEVIHIKNFNMASAQLLKRLLTEVQTMNRTLRDIKNGTISKGDNK